MASNECKLHVLADCSDSRAEHSLWLGFQHLFQPHPVGRVAVVRKFWISYHRVSQNWYYHSVYVTNANISELYSLVVSIEVGLWRALIEVLTNEAAMEM